jgi:hypothetical protein
MDYNSLFLKTISQQNQKTMLRGINFYQLLFLSLFVLRLQKLGHIGEFSWAVIFLPLIAWVLHYWAYRVWKVMEMDLAIDEWIEADLANRRRNKIREQSIKEFKEKHDGATEGKHS